MPRRNHRAFSDEISPAWARNLERELHARHPYRHNTRGKPFMKPEETLAAAFATPRDVTANQMKARAYNPDFDEQADKLRTLGNLITPNQRMQLGYHESARTAHNEIGEDQ